MMKRFNRPALVLWYYDQLVDAFRDNGSPALHGELELLVREMTELAAELDP